MTEKLRKPPWVQQFINRNNFRKKIIKLCFYKVLSVVHDLSNELKESEIQEIFFALWHLLSGLWNIYLGVKFWVWILTFLRPVNTRDKVSCLCPNMKWKNTYGPYYKVQMKFQGNIQALVYSFSNSDKLLLQEENTSDFVPCYFVTH